uniref:Uncharacterized protein n=1 Tax=Anguilla anguilla TaxID=7936 RepID=A0A0E9VL79_ANGAN
MFHLCSKNSCRKLFDPYILSAIHRVAIKRG